MEESYSERSWGVFDGGGRGVKLASLPNSLKIHPASSPPADYHNHIHTEIPNAEASALNQTPNLNIYATPPALGPCYTDSRKTLCMRRKKNQHS